MSNNKEKAPLGAGCEITLHALPNDVGRSPDVPVERLWLQGGACSQGRRSCRLSGGQWLQLAGKTHLGQKLKEDGCSPGTGELAWKHSFFSLFRGRVFVHTDGGPVGTLI